MTNNLNRLLKLLHLCLKNNYPFVCYRLPGEEKVITWIQRSGAMQFVEHYHEVSEKEGFVYAPFHRLTNFPVVFFEPEIIFQNEEFDESLMDELDTKEPIYPAYDLKTPVEISKSDYLRQAEQMISSFDNEFLKAVLSRVQLREKPKSFSPAKFFFTLCEKYPAGFCHLINIPGAGCWLGASPETLLRSDGTNAFTMALAGTQPLLENEEYHWEAKETKEQELVMEHIEETLANCGIENVKRSVPETMKAGQVVHLSTRYDFRVADMTSEIHEFVQQLHPTPAVCGLPKEQALQMINDVEKHNREYYAGFCGPINHQKLTDLFINLRCMKVLPHKLALFSGGGLTSGSVPEKEWQETQLKAATLLSVI